MSQRDINVVALVKGEERYIFLFNDDNKSETLRSLGRYASDPELSFSWYDAAVLSQKVRNVVSLGQEAANPTRSQSVGSQNRFQAPKDLFSGDDQF